MSAGSTTSGQQHLGATMRRDAWWLELLPVIILLGAFGAYATLRAFEGKFYEWGPYLSPFYSPLIDAHHNWWPWSPALLILAFPLGFRVTCYYYRKAYYRARAAHRQGNVLKACRCRQGSGTTRRLLFEQRALSNGRLAPPARHGGDFFDQL